MDEPITRNEQFLQGAVNAANGQATGDLPEPITREEKYLKVLVDALENGGGGEYKKFAYVNLTDYTFVNNDPVEITGDLDRTTFNKYWQEVEYLPVIIDFSYNGDDYTVVAGTLNTGEMYIIGEMENIESGGLKSRITIRLFADPNVSEQKVYAIVNEIPALGTMIVNLTATSSESAVANKTNGEIYEWIVNGGTAKIYLTMGNNVYIADISTAVYTEDDPATTNLIALLPNTLVGAFYIVQTGDAADDNTDWSLQVVPFPS